MDLTKGPPSSPYDKLGGIVFLPRSIDKMRAHLAGTAGEYNAKTGYSVQLFEFLDLAADEFEAVVAAHADDAGVLAALMERTPRSAAEIEAFNERAINRTPEDEAGWQRHWMLLAAAGHGDRKDITTMFDRLDLDDGRDVPPRS
jgi:hypothetical protein